MSALGHTLLCYAAPRELSHSRDNRGARKVIASTISSQVLLSSITRQFPHTHGSHDCDPTMKTAR